MKRLTIRSVVYGLLGIGLVITVHELGHWSFCKLFGVATPEFAIGFGPTIFEKDIGATKFLINALPLGGYVEISGMRQPVPGFERFSLITKPLWQQLLILLGGIIFNLIFGLMLLLFAAPSRLRRGEISEEALSDPALHPQGTIGPFGIIALVSRSSLYGSRLFAIFLGLISLNLAVFNLLPLPILDGGQIFITLLQAATGTVLSPEAYELLSAVTLILFVFLFVAATRSDIKRGLSQQ